MIGEKNKLIAEFMGFKIEYLDGIKEDWVFLHPFQENTRVSKLKFHTSWDWLMPVVEFIDSMGFTTRIESSTDIIGPHYYGCWIWQDPEDNPIAATAHMSTRIEAVYVCVCDFIEWYKTNHPLTQ